VDEAYAGKSRSAANNTGNASVETRDTTRAGDARDKTINRQAEHASRATAEAGATEHSASAFAKSTAAEADANAAFYTADETGSGGETGAAFESLDSASAEPVNAADATVDASRLETQHADDSTCAGTRTRPQCQCTKPSAANTASSDAQAGAAEQFAAIATI
jgi:hypothetical protein